MITVRKLIAELKKMPPDATVATRDHDHGEAEINGFISRVEIAPKELIAARQAYGEHFHGLVVLS